MRVTEKYIKQRIAVIEGWFEKYPAEVIVDRFGKKYFRLAKRVRYGGEVVDFPLTSYYNIETLKEIALIILKHEDIIKQLNKKEL